MDKPTRDLIDLITHYAVAQFNLERELRSKLLDADQPTRSEICYYMADTLNMHRDLPDDVVITLDRCEQYIAHRLKLATWKCDYDALMEEYQNLADDTEDNYFLPDEDKDA